MRFDILTLFPEMFEATLDNSIIGRAKNKGLVEINYIQIRKLFCHLLQTERLGMSTEEQ